MKGRPEGGYTDVFEFPCRDRGDRPGLDCREVSPELEQIRRPYPGAAGEQDVSSPCGRPAMQKTGLRPMSNAS